MKKTLLLIPVFIFAKYYSIQLFTADKNAIQSTLRYYDSLPEKIRNLSVVYKTQSGYLTVRYMVCRKIKNLKKHTRGLNGYSFVNDDPEKIKKLFLEKYTKNKNESLKKLLLKLKWLKKKENKKVPVTVIHLKHKKQKKAQIKLPDWIKMAIALHNYNTEKIKALLHSNIDYTQKITAYLKLKQYKNAQSEIFSHYSQKLSYTYLESIKKNAYFFKYRFSVLKNNTYTNTYNTFTAGSGKLKIKISSERILHTDDKKAEFKNSFLNVALEKINKSNLLSINYKHTFYRKYTFSAGINDNIYDNDTLYISGKQHYISFKYSFLHGFDSKLLYAGFYTFSNKKILDKYMFLVENNKNINFLTTNFSYAKFVKYSGYLNSYFEFGDVLQYGSEENHLKVFKPFFALGVLYNSETKTGYSLKAGISRSFIKADSFESFIKIYKNSLTDEKDTEYTIQYIYFF